MKCGNETISDPRNPAQKLSYCAFHQPNCVNISAHNDDINVSIKFPNPITLCTECYMAKLKNPPPKLPVTAIPGRTLIQLVYIYMCSVLLYNIYLFNYIYFIWLTISGLLTGDGKPLYDARTTDADTASASLQEEKENDELVPDCHWKPNAVESLTEKRGYICKNKVFRNPYTKALLPFCPMHLKTCVKIHSGGDGVILQPNMKGLCTTHYLGTSHVPWFIIILL